MSAPTPGKSRPLPGAVSRYLSRLGLDGVPAPTAAGLAALHRGHLDAVPYDNLAIMLGRPDVTDPRETLRRIGAGGNAGYCFHHNGAFEVALRALGFDVERRSGHVWNTPEARQPSQLNHLVLLVTIEGRRWWPDTGLGDGFRDPVEVAAGKIRQHPFGYEITEVGAGGWTFRHDRDAGSFAALDVLAASPTAGEVAAAHRVLSTPPDGSFSRVLVVARRDAEGSEILRGITHQRKGGGAFARDLTGYDDWRGALAALGVSFAGVTDAELRSLHARMLAAGAERAELAAGA